MNKGDIYYTVDDDGVVRNEYVCEHGNGHIVLSNGVVNFVRGLDFKQDVHWCYETEREANAEYVMRLKKQSRLYVLTNEEHSAIDWWLGLDMDTAFSFESDFKLGMLGVKIDEILDNKTSYELYSQMINILNTEVKKQYYFINI